MEKVVEFLQENPVQYLATVGRDGKVGLISIGCFIRRGIMDCSSAVSPAVRKPGIMKKASEICCWRRDIRLVRVASCLNRRVRTRKASGEQESVGQFPRSWFLIVPIAGNR